MMSRSGGLKNLDSHLIWCLCASLQFLEERVHADVMPCSRQTNALFTQKSRSAN